MKYLSTALLAVIICIDLVGCAADPKLGRADTTGFDAANAAVFIEYAVDISPLDELDEDEIAEQRSIRYEEIKQVLQAHGFNPVSGGQANFHIKVSESVATDITGEWTGAAGATTVIMTLGIVPAVFTYSARIHYELWSGDELLHAIDTPAQWDEAVGLISFSSTLSGTDAAKSKARTNAHDSVVRLWIEQGSFE